MRLNDTLSSLLCFLLAFGVANLGLMKSSHAAMITTQEAVSQLSHQQNLEKVSDFMQRGEVKEKLIAMGVDPIEANLRLNYLSNAEVADMAWQIDNNVAGADIIVIGLTTILLIVIIILLVQRI